MKLKSQLNSSLAKTHLATDFTGEVTALLVDEPVSLEGGGVGERHLAEVALVPAHVAIHGHNLDEIRVRQRICRYI